jgi:hypothetical protein
MQLPSQTKESRYWPWEIPIAILLVIGVLVVGIGVPMIILPHSDWATLFLGAFEGLVGLGMFAGAPQNALRGGAIALFFSGSVAFVVGLASIVSSTSAPVPY